MLPKDLVKPKPHHTFPSERAYFDESKATLAKGVIIDDEKSGADYGIKDYDVTEPVADTDGGDA